MESGRAPSLQRRWLAVLAIVATALVIVMLVGFLVRQPLLLIGGFVGLALIGAGGWWLVTEQNPRRMVGVVAIIGGVVVLVWTVLDAYGDGENGWWRLAVLVGLAAVAIGAARAAMVRDLHEIDTLRSGHVHPRKPVLICNPKSGGGKVEKFGLIAMAEEMGVEVVLLTPGKDLAQLARDAIAAGADCLGMAGGDGSQALVASIAIEHGIPFVCISAGTRNHFALDLGFDKEDPRKGMIALRDGVERYVDYATVGDRLFVNNVSLGVYATIVQDDEYRDAKRETTQMKLPELLGRQAEPFDLQFTDPEGREVDGSFVILVSNNPYVMGPSLDVSQRRAMDTGQLGVFAITASSGAEAGKLVARTALGLGKRDPNLFDFQTTAFEVRSRSGHALAGVDGEALDLPTPLHFQTHPKGLRLLVPADDLLAAEKRRARAVSLRALTDIARGKPSRAS